MPDVIGSVLVSLGVDLDAFRRGLRDAQSQLDSAANKMKSAGEKMSLAISAPILAAGGLMLKGALDAEKAQGKLQAQLGITAKEADELGKVAKEVWAEGFGENVNESFEVIKNVRQTMGDLADKELKEVAKGAMTIAEVFDQDVNEVTKAASVAMKNFNISGTEALDVITVGFQKGGDFAGDLLDTITEYSPQFNALGFTMDQAMAILIKGAEEGAFNLDKVGDAMKEFNLRAQDGSKTTKEAFEALGFESEKMGRAIASGGEESQKAFQATLLALAAIEDPLERNRLGTALFGTQWEDVREKVVLAMNEGIKGLEGFEGANKRATEAMKDNPIDKMTAAFRKLQLALQESDVAQRLAETVEKMAGSLERAIKAFNELDPGAQTAIISFGLVLAAIGPLLIVFGQLATAVSSIIGLFGGAGAAGGLAGALTAIISPIGAAVLVITGAFIAIGVALKQLWTENKEFREGVTKLWNEMKESAKKIWSDMKADFEENWKRWGPIITQFWEGFKEQVRVGTLIVMNLISGFLKIISGDWEGAWNNIKNIFSHLWGQINEDTRTRLTTWYNTIMGIINNVKTIFNGFSTFFSGVFSGNWSKAWSGIQTIFSTALNALPGVAKTALNSVIGFVNSAIRALNRVKIPDWVPGVGGTSPHISTIPRLATGTNFVPDNMLAYLHRGEAVIPAANNPANPNANNPMGGVTINIANANIRSQDDIRMLAREIFLLQQTRARASGVVYG